MRIVLGRLPGTGISLEQSKGISPSPIARAEAAGKSEVRSSVTVNMTEIKSSTLRAFDLSISSMSSTTATPISWASSRSTWVAPLIALTNTGGFYSVGLNQAGIF